MKLLREQIEKDDLKNFSNREAELADKNSKKYFAYSGTLMYLNINLRSTYSKQQ